MGMQFTVAGQPKSKPLTIECVLDSGATVTIVHSRFARLCGIMHNNKPVMCSAAEGSMLQCVGSAKVKAFCRRLNKTITTQVLFSDTLEHDCLLGSARFTRPEAP